KKEIRQEEEKGGKEEKGIESRPTCGQPCGHHGRRATRAESSRRMAVPYRLPAVTGNRGNLAGARAPVRPRSSADRPGQSAQERNLGRSARLHPELKSSVRTADSIGPLNGPKGRNECRNKGFAVHQAARALAGEVIDSIGESSL